ncbi:MAG: enhanced serine sensitivity protein SseB C-terminal domain-containing protein [Telluria sp.]
MPPSPIQPDTHAESPGLSIAAFRHPPLEQAIGAACAELPVREAYLAAVRDPALGAQPRLLLAITGGDTRIHRRLAALIAELLPDDLDLDLIELAEDSLSMAVRRCCEPFFRV